MAEVNIDVAKEASVQGVNSKVGASSDTASSSPTTLFAGIKGLIAWFTGTWTATRAGYIDNMNINTSISSTASKTGILSQKSAYIISLLENATYGLSAIRTALTGGGVPAVKSVQRGRYHNLNLPYSAVNMEDGTTSSIFVDIPISSVVLRKSTVIISSAPRASGNGSPAAGRLLNSTTLRLYCNTASGYLTDGTAYFYNVCWEVVEFN